MKTLKNKTEASPMHPVKISARFNETYERLANFVQSQLTNMTGYWIVMETTHTSKDTT